MRSLILCKSNKDADDNCLGFESVENTHLVLGYLICLLHEMKKNWSQTLWNEEIRRCEVVDILQRR